MNRISLGCQAFDELLRGGIEKGSVTLFYGEAGVGKTNICLQLAYNVIKEGKKVAYLDAEGLSSDRLLQVFKEEEDTLKNLLIFPVHSFEEQSDKIDKIARVAENDVLGLIVVDSMTMYYRLNYDDSRTRNDFVKQTEILLGIARKYDVPVLIISQVYTNMNTGGVEFLGGHSMHHNAKTIIRLEKKGTNTRTAIVVKHRSIPEGRSATYRITETGIGDV